MYGREIAFLVVAAVACILNITESILIIRQRKRWKPFDKLLLSLSAADQLVAMATIVYYSMSLAGVSVKGHELSTEYFVFVLVSSEDYSVLHITAITVDRFMAVKRPLQHNMRMQGKLPVLFIAAVWLSVLVLNGVFISIVVAAHDKVMITVKVFSALLILLGISFAVAYRHMFQLVVKQASLRSRTNDSETNFRCQLKELLFLEKCRKERTMLITCCLVLSSYIICMYPIAVETLIATKSEEISVASQLLLVANSALNPIVYFFKGYRERRTRDERREQLLKDCNASYLTSSSKVKGTEKGKEDKMRDNTKLTVDE